MRRLVLIEGMIGAGKSTTAERLAARLMEDGDDVRVFLEFADDHPIRTRHVDVLRDAGPAPAGAYDGGQWSALADRCARGDHTVIVESTLLQNSVMPHFFDDAPVGVVKAVFADIVARIAPAAPLLIHLRPSDVADAVRRVHAERGEPWSSRNYAFVSACRWARRRGLIGEQAVIELYRAWEPVVDDLLSTVESVLVVDPRRDWAGMLERLHDVVSTSGTRPGAGSAPGGKLPCRVEDFDPADAYPLTRMWRESFERGVGIVDTHPMEEQIAFLLEELVPNNAVRVAKHGDRIVGFSASTPESISALYVRVENIGQGIGARLLNLAKAHSSGSLWLHTFARNVRARRFYERHGFVEGEHAREAMWRLEDVKYRWTRAGSAA